MLHRISRHAACLIASISSLMLLSAGCNGAETPSALSPTLATERQDIPTAMVASGITTELLVPWRLEVDPATLDASLMPVIDRTATGFQATLSDLDISAFLKPGTLAVKSVRRSNGGLRLEYAFRHPFPAPDFAAPPSAKNRADLGVTGRLLILADLPVSQVPQNTYFGDVILNPRAIGEIDGFFSPGDLLRMTGLNTNTFPYKLLANESLSNRTGVPNGDPEGNYDPLLHGWQRHNIELSGVNNGWTGYDFVHQGQEVVNEFLLTPDAFNGKPLTLNLAIVIKYVDPKSISPRTDPLVRFPAEPPISTYFAYRLPYGALDCSEIYYDFDDPLVFDDTTGQSLPVAAYVRDWDTGATEATDSDLSDEADVSLVQPGTGATPVVDFDCPALLTTPGVIDYLGGSGLPRDELHYSATLTTDLVSEPGQLFGLIRATDPEADLPDANAFHFGVDPVTLVADPARALRSVTYQTVPITVYQNDTMTWSRHTVDTGGSTGYNSSLGQLAGGRFGIANYDSDTATLEFFVSNDATPGAQADWASHTVDDASLDVGNDPDLLIRDGGGLAVSYHDVENGALRIALTGSDLPTAPADWTTHEIDSNGNCGLDSGIAEVNGRLLLIYSQRDLIDGTKVGDERIAFAKIANPTGAANWDIYSIAQQGALYDAEGDVAILPSGLPIIALHEQTGAGGPQPNRGRLFCGIATDNTPIAASDWNVHLADDLGPSNLPGLGCQIAVSPTGFPAIAHTNDLGGHLRVSLATTTAPSNAGNWRSYNIPGEGFTGYDPSIAFSTDSRITIAHYGFGEGIFWVHRSINPSPQSPADWTVSVLDLEFERHGQNPSLIALPDDSFAVTYADDTEGWLKFARTDSPW